MSRAALFQQLLDQAAKELRCKVTDEKAKHVAVLRLALESVQTKLIAGRDIDPSALRWLSEQLEKYATPPPEPTTLTIQYIDGTRKTCPFCKATFNPHDPDPKPLSSDPD